MSPARPVRITERFFNDVDRHFGPERGPRGEPSAADFTSLELPEIIHVFAETFDDLPELIPGRPDCRILIAAGFFAPRFAVIGQLAPDGAVELVQLDLDLEAEP